MVAKKNTKAKDPEEKITTSSGGTKKGSSSSQKSKSSGSKSSSKTTKSTASTKVEPAKEEKKESRDKTVESASDGKKQPAANASAKKPEKEDQSNSAPAASAKSTKKSKSKDPGDTTDKSEDKETSESSKQPVNKEPKLGTTGRRMQEHIRNYVARKGSDPTANAQAFTRVVRFAMQNPVDEVLDQLLEIFTKRTHLIAETPFKAVVENQFQNTSLRISRTYSIFECMADCLRGSSSSFPLSLNACRIAVDNDELMDYVARKMNRYLKK